MLTAVNTGITNDNGVVEYSQNLEEALAAAKNNKDTKNLMIDLKNVTFDKTLKYPLSTFAEMP